MAFVFRYHVASSSRGKAADISTPTPLPSRFTRVGVGNYMVLRTDPHDKALNHILSTAGTCAYAGPEGEIRIESHGHTLHSVEVTKGYG
jgi:hypothetical protein